MVFAAFVVVAESALALLVKLGDDRLGVELVLYSWYKQQGNSDRYRPYHSYQQQPYRHQL